MNKLKIDIGCGRNKKDVDYIGVDKYGGKQVDVVFNLENLKFKGVQLPWPDSSVDEIYCSHTLEHLDCPVEVMNEFHRLLRPRIKDSVKPGWLTLIVPHAQSWSAFADPTHKSFFVPKTFERYFKSDALKEYQKKSIQHDLIKPWHIRKINFTPVPDMVDPFTIDREIYIEMSPLK